MCQLPDRLWTAQYLARLAITWYGREVVAALGSIRR